MAETRAPRFAPCGAIECAEFVVPVSRDGTRGGTLTLKAYRRTGSSTAPDKRTIIVHPGGPGASVRRLVENFAEFFGAKAEKFDVIGLSTRGSADGTRSECTTDLGLIVDASESPAAAAEVAAGCLSSSRPLVGNVGTLDAVDDLEALRRALGLEKVGFMGWSYGATLGAAWVMLHPASLETAVLDAPADPSVAWSEQFSTLVDMQQLALRNGLAWCESVTTCALAPSSSRRLRMLYDRLSGSVPGDGPGARPVDGSTLSMAVELQLYSSAFGELFDAVAAAERGSYSRLVRLADARLGRGDDGVDDGGMETQVMVRCSDLTLADAEAAVEVRSANIPADIPVGIGAAIERICTELPPPPRPFWSVTPSDSSFGASVLVVTSVGDPVMPHVHAVGLARRLGWGVHTVESSQHLAVGFDATATEAAVRCLLRTICQ